MESFTDSIASFTESLTDSTATGFVFPASSQCKVSGSQQKTHYAKYIADEVDVTEDASGRWATGRRIA